jgi:hypothetical protein
MLCGSYQKGWRELALQAKIGGDRVCGVTGVLSWDNISLKL